MSAFTYQNGVLSADGVSLADVAARFATPCYVYSRAALAERYAAFETALAGVDHALRFAVKANGNIGVLGVLADLGSGFDIVSVGELERVLTAGGKPSDVVFSGVGKRVDEIERALEVGIGCFNVESESELARVDTIARRMGLCAPISIRVNPDVDARTHPYIATGLRQNKFGVAIEQAEALYGRAAAMEGLAVRGVDCHIGSQLTELGPFAAAAERVKVLVDRLAARGIDLEHIDIGGGLGIRYADEAPPAVQDYVAAIIAAIGDCRLRLVLEPGRAIAGNAGVLLTRVDTLKPAAASDARAFAVVDAAMNDLLRPALYDAWHDIAPVVAGRADGAGPWDIVGPVCETGDRLGCARDLNLAAGDVLAIHSAGAYAATMNSTYNARPRPPEILLAEGQAFEVRARETVADLMRGERRLPVQA